LRTSQKKVGWLTRLLNPNLAAAHDGRLTMLENTFSNDEAAITPADLDHLESAIGKKLPTPFRNHYLLYNGGVPERTYWVSEDFDEPLEVAAFKPITGGDSTLLSTYQLMLKNRYFLHTSYLSRTTGAATSFA